MNLRNIFAAIVLASIGQITAVQAANLRVAPVMVRVPHGATTDTVRVWNDEAEPLNIQVRVFRWTVRNGRDVLEPTRDVVASPPMASLAGGTENLIRVVRVAPNPVAGREQYRLIIDQLPNREPGKSGTVKVLVRHAIPVYFE